MESVIIFCALSCLYKNFLFCVLDILDLFSLELSLRVDPSVEQGLTTMRHNWALGRLQDQLVIKLNLGGNWSFWGISEMAKMYHRN